MGDNPNTIFGLLTSKFAYSHEVCSELFYSCIASAEIEIRAKDYLPISSI